MDQGSALPPRRSRGRHSSAGRGSTTSGHGNRAVSGYPDIGLLRQLWGFRAYGRAELRALLLGVGMRFGELVADLATPWPLALVIDNLFKGKQIDGKLGAVAYLFGPSGVGVLAVASLSVLVITSLSGVFDYLGDRILNSAGERITSAIRSDLFGHLQRLPMRYHDRHAVGELMSRIGGDTARIEDSLVGLFSTLIPGVVSLTGFSVVLLSVNWRLGLIALCAAPLVFFTASRYSRLTRTSARRRRAAEGLMTGFVAESLQGIRTIHVFGRQDLHDDRFGAENNAVLETGLRAVELRARFTPLLETVAALGAAALLFVGGYGVIAGWWTIGVLVVVTSYLRDMLSPMRSLSKLSLTFTQGAASAERVTAILAQERPVKETDQPLPDRVAGSIQLRRVVLDYGRGPVLNNLDLAIRPGERIALLGHNGAGKSTVLAVISGLYAPSGGDVLLDGVPLSQAPESWLHSQIAILLQDTFLFSGTLTDNIRFGRPDASDAEIARVADAALVTEFTAKLPNGLDTEVSAGGVGLSGGQRQRVGIARALLLDAPVVLLDEPTTGLDAHAEELVVRALTRLVHGRTVVMTTHQPALTRLATRTVHLHQGTILPPLDPPDRLRTHPTAPPPRRRIGSLRPPHAPTQGFPPTDHRSPPRGGSPRP
ncbi:MAG: ATP-binding cassette, subfamily bacterial [Pseudonocardiales bacterium]|nr:ATP-binding cassette, subfamily bacterial [Pseudonocardiales bacterium]